MARIRTIKPEFWTDETVTECSLTARLLFIGLWNFADDNGNIERSSKQMKMKIFPADNVEVEPLVIELMANGLLIEYETNGHKYLNIKGFTKHQVINKPSKTGHPKLEDSLNTTVALRDDSSTEGKGMEVGREGNGMEKETTTAAAEKMPLSECRKLYMTYFGTINENQPIVQVLQDICHEYPPERIKEAFQAAAAGNKLSLNWVRERLKHSGGVNGNNTATSRRAGNAGAKTGFLEANGPEADWLGTGSN